MVASFLMSVTSSSSISVSLEPIEIEMSDWLDPASES